MGFGPPVDGWSPAGTIDDRAISHREVAGSSIPATRIGTTFDAPPGNVLSVVTDYSRFAGFVPLVRESQVLDERPDVQWVYHRLDLPGPLSDREYVIRSELRHDPRSGCILVRWRLADRSFPGTHHQGTVRPESLSGFWLLRPLGDGGATRAWYSVHSDPGGYLPRWLVIGSTHRYLAMVLEAVRLRLAGE